MTYPDYDFYRTVFGGSEEEEVIMPFIRKGADILGGYITDCEISDNNETELFRAVCAQGEFMEENEGFSSVKLGDITASYEKRGIICPRAAAILEKSGLLFRGVTVRNGGE